MRRILKYWPLLLIVIMLTVTIILALIFRTEKTEQPPKTAENSNTDSVILSPGRFSEIQEALPGFTETTDLPSQETISGTTEGGEINSSSTSDGSGSDPSSGTETQKNHNVVSPELSRDIPKTRSRFPKVPTNLRINGVTCAYDETSRTYCYTVSERSVGKQSDLLLTGEYGSETLYAVFPNGEIGSDAQYTPKANQTIEIRLFTDTCYEDYHLRISTMPVLSLETENRTPLPDGNDKETELYCAITLQDPDSDLHGGDAYVASYATVRYRGASSLKYPKKSMKIELQKFKTDASGNTVMTDRKKSLLGMRDDDDWILDAIYADPTLIHNKAAYDLWSELGGKTNPNALLAGPNCEYVEVILNGSYHGVYLLVEPVDEKQTGVQKSENTEDGSHGIFIKTTSWEMTKFDAFKGSPKSNGTWKSVWGGFEMKYPKTKISESDWNPIIELLDATANGSDAEFSKVASKYIDKENAVNYWIFLSVTLARDNSGKNICWSMANTSVAEKKLYINVWDCDNTFGYRYGIPPIKDPATTANYADTWFLLLRRYLECNVDGSADYLKQRWKEVSAKGSRCSASALITRMETEAEFLQTSGAFEREQNRWPASGGTHSSCPNPLSKELEYATDWITERIPIVDTLVNNY